MTLAELLEQLRRSSVGLRRDGDALRVTAPPGAVTPELAAAIRSHKPELLRLLGESADFGPCQKGRIHIERSPEQSRYPLSTSQLRASAVNGNAAMLPSAFRFTGPLDRDALHATLQEIVRRHAPLHSRFLLDGAEPVQLVTADTTTALPETDLQAMPEAQRAGALRQLLAEQARTPLDLTSGPPFRFHLFRCSPTDHAIFAGFSPLAFDGWSFDVFWNELRHGYAARHAGRPWPFEPLTVSYADVVADQRRRLGHDHERLATFWREALGSELPAAPLPTDFPRPPVVSGRGVGLPFELPRATVARLDQRSRELGLTPQMLMLGGLFAWATRLSGEREQVIGTPVDARLHPATEALIGSFANIILIRFGCDTEQSFAATVRELRDRCLSAYQYQEYPLHAVDVEARRRPGERFAPAFQLEFSYQQVHGRGAEMGDLTLSQIEVESGAAGSDITLWVKDWGDRINGAVEFRPELFEADTIAHWIGCYRHLLDQLLAAPDRPIGELDLLGPERRAVEEAMARGAAPAIVDRSGNALPIGIPGRLASGGDGVFRLLRSGQVERCPTTAWRRPSTNHDPIGEGTATEQRIAALFAELTGADDVTPDESFFDLGGTSIKAVRLFTKIHELFGVRLPLTTIVEADTPARLAKRISGGIGRQGSLVEFAAGEDLMLFLVHDADGESLHYRDLARHLPPGIAVCGLEPAPRGELAIAQTSVEEFAQDYIEQIRKRAPRGPYCLGGLCAGGVIAFEMARQLQAAGERVGLLVLHECGTPQAAKRHSPAAGRLSRLLDGIARPTPGKSRLAVIGDKVRGYLRYRSEAGRSRNRQEELLSTIRRVRSSGASWPADLAAPNMREIWDAIERNYVPSALAGVPAVLYRAAHGEGSDLAYRDLLADPLFGWSGLLDNIAAVDVAGGHFTSLRAPTVTNLAADLGKRLCALITDNCAPAGAPTRQQDSQPGCSTRP